MAVPASPRAGSTDCSSAGSNIIVQHAPHPLSEIAEEPCSSSAPSLMGSVASSERGEKCTPGTSVDESVAVATEGRRLSARAARGGVRDYNLKRLSDAQLPIAPPSATAAVLKRRPGSANLGMEIDREEGPGSRNVSGLTGRTLIGEREDDEDEDLKAAANDKASAGDAEAGVDGELPSDPAGRPRTSTGRLARQPSVTERVKKAAGKVTSVLGKRAREVFGLGEKESKSDRKTETKINGKTVKMLKELDTGVKGLLDEMNLDEEVPVPHTKEEEDEVVEEEAMPPPSKRAKLSKSEGKGKGKEFVIPAAVPDPTGRRAKKWQREGLYVGQTPDLDPTLRPAGVHKKLQKRPPSSASTSSAMPSSAPFMPLPMYGYLAEEKTRDFAIPFNIYAPTVSKNSAKPQGWTPLNRNRLVGDAKEIWDQSEKLAASKCVCDTACEENCLNRIMQYECNDANCNTDADVCSNRAFASLATRKDKAYQIGVEVVQTDSRGFGIRSCREWSPGAIIMEYTGEIITEEECQRRMHALYAGKDCYYLMELERGLVIDGTKGSMARFINHSCEPNCEVRMVKVEGRMRMGVFAGEAGLQTGQELTYDYNFDNFGTTHQRCYCGAETCRGYLSKRLNATELKKVVKQEEERKRRAAEEGVRHAREIEMKKKKKDERGSAWRGWLDLNDPENVVRLKREKEEREAKARGSSRALRAEQRKSVGGASAGVVKKESKKPRRKSLPAAAGASKVEDDEDVGMEDAAPDASPGPRRPVTAPTQVAESDIDEANVTVAHVLAEIQETPRSVHKKHVRASSTASKFTEDLIEARPGSSMTTKTTRTSGRTSLEITETKTTRRVSSTGADLEVAQEEEVAEKKADRRQSVKAQATAAAENDATAGAAEEPKGLGRKRSVREKSKDVMRSVGQAVKSSLKGTAVGLGAGEVKEKEKGGLRQSTLSFAKMG